ncbi:MAG: hypothetical protein CV089_06315 [Nitrospira sp. WS110]|nr:hypothetical protein [Nitrospira sp. WS110]
MNGYTTAVFFGGVVLGGMVIPAVFASQDREKNSKSIQEVLPAQSDREQSLEAKVERRLRLRDDLQWANLAVEAKGSHVTLMGEVATEQDRALATNIASTIPGVTAITNRIIVNSDLSLTERSMRNGPADREGRNVMLDGQHGVKRKAVLP